MEYFRAALINLTRVDPRDSNRNVLKNLVALKDSEEDIPSQLGSCSPTIKTASDNDDVAVTITISTANGVSYVFEVKYVFHAFYSALNSP